MPMCLCYNIYDAVLYFQESEMISSLWKQHNISLSWAFLIAQLVKNLSAMQETPVREDHWRRDTLPTTVFLGFSCGSAGIESACNAGDLGWIPGSGRSPGEGKGYPLQYSGLENSMDSQSPRGRKESHTTERLSLSLGAAKGTVRKLRERARRGARSDPGLLTCF